MAPDYSVNTKGLALELTQEFLITYILTFACDILFVIPFKIHFVHILRNLCQLYIFIGIFVQPLRIGHIVIGLYQAARETRQFQAPVPKAQDNKPKKDRQQPLAIPLPQDMYLDENQARQTLVIRNDSLPTPSSVKRPERKETPIPSARQEIMTDITSTADTLVSQVTPLMGIMPHESTQLQSMNTPEDVEEILGTRAFQRYVDTPIQTLDRIVVNQPKCFLPLAQEAKKIADEITLEKINEQWAGIPQEQLLNQSFNDKLNSIQILEQLAPLQLTKDHLLGNIIDILERLGKADHIPHNQLYYIAENCANRYYSKVIETFMALLKWQFADRQLLLVNTARSLKFLEEYADRQALIWQIFRKQENIPDDISNLHLHIDDFKTNIKKEFNFLKEVTRKNIENFQTLLNLKQTYSVALCSYVNNIYHKILEIQRQLPHFTQHMNTGNIIQIDVPDFDPDIDEGLPTQEHQEAQGSASITQQFFEKSKECKAPALLQ